MMMDSVAKRPNPGVIPGQDDIGAYRLRKHLLFDTAQ
jgi:hypothetical protein